MKTISRYLLTLVALLAMTAGAWADPNILAPTITGDREFYESVEVTMICTSPNADIYYTLDGSNPKDDGPLSTAKEYKNAFTLTETTTIKAASYDGNDWSAIVEVTFTKLTGPEVTFNDAKTTASFEMPGNDVTVSYELVRDITQKVDVEVRIDGTATERVRIAKDGDGHYKFVTKQEWGWQFAAVDKLDNNKDLTNGELTYTFKMKEGNDYVAKNFDTDLCPGTWRLEATANAEKPYEGTAYGKDITLFEGYEVTVPAGEYITYYRDEPLKLDDADKESIELYTVSSVTATEAVLSDPFDAAPANTPLLVYNKNTEEAKTILLIPCNEPDLLLTVADEFKGTLEATTIPASTTGADNYALNGYAFVWVKTAIEVGANKCWLNIVSQPATSRGNTRSIIGGNGTTGIDAIENVTIDNEGWYDLQGRKLQSAPNRKGIYIHNGKKVVVRK